MVRNKECASTTARLRSDVLDGDVNITSSLRRAKVLAAELHHDGFRAWVDAELFGYRGDPELPDYRIFRTDSFGTFSGPFQRVINNFLIPVFNLPDEVRELATEVRLNQPVGELEALARKGQDLQEFWPTEAVLLARDRIQLSGGYILVEARKLIPCYICEGIVETVRNKLLEFIIELQKLNPEILETDEAVNQILANDVANVFITTISGGQNVVATGVGNTQNVKQGVVVGDFSTLEAYLQGLGVSPEDVNELRSAIDADGKRAKGSFGELVKNWLARFTQKALDGLFNVAVSSAVPLVIAAVEQFYGWS